MIWPPIWHRGTGRVKTTFCILTLPKLPNATCLHHGHHLRVSNRLFHCILPSSVWRMVGVCGWFVPQWREWWWRRLSEAVERQSERCQRNVGLQCTLQSFPAGIRASTETMLSVLCGKNDGRLVDKTWIRISMLGASGSWKLSESLLPHFWNAEVASHNRTYYNYNNSVEVSQGNLIGLYEYLEKIKDLNTKLTVKRIIAETEKSHS